jgi:hypothetical protein
MKSKQFTPEMYVKALVKKLGSHYSWERYPADAWLGFIYCKCYRFAKSDKYLPGAVARVERTQVVILDFRRSYTKN